MSKTIGRCQSHWDLRSTSSERPPLLLLSPEGCEAMARRIARAVAQGSETLEESWDGNFRGKSWGFYDFYGSLLGLNIGFLGEFHEIYRDFDWDLMHGNASFSGAK